MSVSKLVACLAVFISAVAFAQPAPVVPAPSPAARADATVGLTNFSIEYSSPGVKGRKVWGTVVPMDKVWRAGANAPTKLTASREFTFGGKKVPAGSYSLLMIPGKANWSVMLSSDPGANQNSYDTKKEVARASVKPETMPSSRERLTYIFSDATDDSVKLDLEWEKTRIRIPISVDTKTHVQAAIDASINDAWRPHFTAARYLLDSNGDMNKALEYADASIAIKPTWWNNWIRAQILAKTGKKADAVAAAEKAKTLGKGDNVYENFFAPQIDAAMKGWK